MSCNVGRARGGCSCSTRGDNETSTREMEGRASCSDGRSEATSFAHDWCESRHIPEKPRFHFVVRVVSCAFSMDVKQE